jgi:anti-sigma B factor antagonist
MCLPSPGDRRTSLSTETIRTSRSSRSFDADADGAAATNKMKKDERESETGRAWFHGTAPVQRPGTTFMTRRALGQFRSGRQAGNPIPFAAPLGPSQIAHTSAEFCVTIGSLSGGFQMDLTTSTRNVGDIAIVDISGRIVLGEESASLRTVISDLLNGGQKKILLNLGDVSYIDSSGLGQLVSTFTTVRRQNGELRLFNLNNKVHDVLQITKLYTVFEISDDEATAVKSFARSTSATA